MKLPINRGNTRRVEQRDDLPFIVVACSNVERYPLAPGLAAIETRGAHRRKLELAAAVIPRTQVLVIAESAAADQEFE